jgi:hypothetical protein
MFTRSILVVFVAATLAACGGEPGANEGSAGAGGAAAAGPTSGHPLTLRASLHPSANELAFLTPAASIARHPVDQVIGKPYYIAAFPAGFSPGNDPALADAWGTVPASLQIELTTPARFASGPYDMVMVVYVTTPITEAMRRGEISPPAAKGGDLASFTLAQVNVREGDPRLEPGLVRVNVEDAPGRVEIENRTPADLTSTEQITAAFDNTILMVP